MNTSSAAQYASYADGSHALWIGKIPQHIAEAIHNYSCDPQDPRFDNLTLGTSDPAPTPTIPPLGTGLLLPRDWRLIDFLASKLPTACQIISPEETTDDGLRIIESLRPDAHAAGWTDRDLISCIIRFGRIGWMLPVSVLDAVRSSIAASRAAALGAEETTKGIATVAATFVKQPDAPLPDPHLSRPPSGGA